MEEFDEEYFEDADNSMGEEEDGLEDIDEEDEDNLMPFEN